MADDNKCPACKADLGFVSPESRPIPQAGNLYSIRMSIFNPLYFFAGETLSSALSYYPGDCAKGPRPCVVFQDLGEDEYLICLMGTFHKQPFDELDGAFQNRVLPVYSMVWDEPAITEHGKNHIHTTPQTNIEYPSYIIPVPVMCRLEDLGDWKPKKHLPSGSPGSGPLQPCRHYLNLQSQLRVLRQEVTKHQSLKEELLQDPVERKRYLDRLEYLSNNRPSNPSARAHSITSKATLLSNSGHTHNSAHGGRSRRTHISFCEPLMKPEHRKAEESASIAHSTTGRADQTKLRSRPPMSRVPPSVGQQSIRSGRSDITSLSSRTQNMSLQGDSSEADRVSTKTGTGRKTNFMNKFRASDNRSVRSGISGVFNFQPSSSKHGKQSKIKTASISSNRFSLLQPSTPPPVSPVAG